MRSVFIAGNMYTNGEIAAAFILALPIPLAIANAYGCNMSSEISTLARKLM